MRVLSNSCVWFLVIAATVCFAVCISMHSWALYTENPTVTSLQSQRYPVWMVPFPTVSVCSINRISRQAAKQYAAELCVHTMHTQTRAQFRLTAAIRRVAHNAQLNVSGTLRQLRYLGRLYDHSEDNFNDLLQFQAILDESDSAPLGAFDVLYRMAQLTPKCSDQLVKCQWQGRDIDCADIFTTRLTSAGYCCTFNNVRPQQILSFAE